MNRPAMAKSSLHSRSGVLARPLLKEGGESVKATAPRLTEPNTPKEDQARCPALFVHLTSLPYGQLTFLSPLSAEQVSTPVPPSARSFFFTPSRASSVSDPPCP